MSVEERAGDQASESSVGATILNEREVVEQNSTTNHFL